MTATIHSTLPDWLSRLESLVERTECWAGELGWATRRIEKQVHESGLGTYKAPALLMQEGATRVLLEPVASGTPGTEGVVDLYRMPAYDDVASLYYHDGEWRLLHSSSVSPTQASAPDAESQAFSKESLRWALEEMRADDSAKG